MYRGIFGTGLAAFAVVEVVALEVGGNVVDVVVDVVVVDVVVVVGSVIANAQSAGAVTGLHRATPPPGNGAE